MKAYLEIEMPKNCCVCPLFKSNMSKQLFCKAFGAFDKSDYDKLPFERMKNCPLVPVPAHGRLIDADNILYETNPARIPTGKGFVTHATIDSLPTVIPAEPAEEKP